MLYRPFSFLLSFLLMVACFSTVPSAQAGEDPFAQGSSIMPRNKYVEPAHSSLTMADRCGENLVLIIRGSSEKPSGFDQPDAITYQQSGADLYADSARQMHGGALWGSGYLGKGAVKYLQGTQVATLVYPAAAITPMGDVENTTGFYKDSVEKGSIQFMKYLRAVFDPCPDNPPRVVVLGYSQGADVINTATSKVYGTPEISYIEKITKIVLLGDPSRRVSGVENDDAWIGAIPTNSVGGVSRAVTDGTPYNLFFPSLDSYRDNHVGQIASYCIPGDLICDTRSGESVRGVEIHVGYADALARLSKDSVRKKYGVENYTQYMNAMYAQVQESLGIPAYFNTSTVATIGPGWTNIILSRGIRNEQVAQKVYVRGVAYNGMVFQSSTATITPAASGSVGVFLPPSIPIAMDLEIYLDDHMVSRVPAIYTYRSMNIARATGTMIYVQGDHDYDRTMGELLVNQIQDWQQPISQRVELIRNLYGEAGVKLYFAWLNFIYQAHLNVPYYAQVEQLIKDGIIPVLNADTSYIISWLRENGIIDEYGNFRIQGYDVIKFLDTFIATR